MKTRIDAAGRIVVPKALRERLGLDGGRVALPSRRLPRLTDDIVRDTLEKTRR